jgi:hypothetical protein
MKREFKFRAWDKVGKRFVKKTSIYSNMIPCTTTRHGFKLNSKFILQQFIGQHDKAGAEIYEGDILLYRGDSHSTSWTIEVFWDEDAFIAKWLSTSAVDPAKWKMKAGHVVWSHFKKVGNIFQTPQLRPNAKSRTKSTTNST